MSAWRVKVGKDLDGKNPGFEGAVLLAEEDAVARTATVKELEGFGVLSKRGAGIVEG